MNKKKDNKRKEILSIKAKNESFRFQVWWNRSKRELDIPDDDPLVNNVSSMKYKCLKIW